MDENSDTQEHEQHIKKKKKRKVWQKEKFSSILEEMSLSN